MNQETIRAAFAKACETNDEFDALEHVARMSGVEPEAVAKIVAKPQEVAAA